MALNLNADYTLYNYLFYKWQIKLVTCSMITFHLSLVSFLQTVAFYQPHIYPLVLFFWRLISASRDSWFITRVLFSFKSRAIEQPLLLGHVRGLITLLLILDMHKIEAWPSFNLSSAIDGGCPLIEYKGASMYCRLLRLHWRAVNVTRSPVSNKNSLAFCVGTNSFMFPKYKQQYGAYDDERHWILSARSVCKK